MPYKGNKMNTRAGFSLIEMMVVLAIMSILAMMVMPSKTGEVVRVQVNEGTKLSEPFKSQIEAYYRVSGTFPKTNKDAAIPEPDKIIGHFVTSINIENGAMHIRYGNKINSMITGKIVSIRPLYVKDSPLSPISWVCGLDEIPNGMTAAGINKTNVEKKNLPLSCR